MTKTKHPPVAVHTIQTYALEFYENLTPAERETFNTNYEIDNEVRFDDGCDGAGFAADYERMQRIAARWEALPSAMESIRELAARFQVTAKSFKPNFDNSELSGAFEAGFRLATEWANFRFQSGVGSASARESRAGIARSKKAGKKGGRAKQDGHKSRTRLRKKRDDAIRAEAARLNGTPKLHELLAAQSVLARFAHLGPIQRPGPSSKSALKLPGAD